PEKTFKPFDRFAQFKESEGKTLNQLLDEFEAARKHSMNALKAKGITENDYNRTGIHPSFGPVTLSQLLSTWTVHDLTHINQVARVMARQYQDAIGPWRQYINMLR
ncbi:MAG TPA: DinB family protein, partial [Bacteroidia bacterium]|nr:DinB family protein [Bacteroidia bacterium]